MSRLRLNQVGEPSAPSTSKVEIWFSNDAVPLLKFKDDAGNVRIIAVRSTVASATPADPAATSDTTGKMMGLAVPITPLVTGRLRIEVTGSIANDTINDGAAVQIRYGTGTAPVNGAALTGTAVGKLKTFTSLVAADRHGFACLAFVSGLTVGTPYWIDVSLKAITAGNANLYDLDVVTEEI